MDQMVWIDEVATGELTSVMPHIAELMADSVSADRCAIFAYAEDQQSTIALFRFGYADDESRAHHSLGPLDPRTVPIERHVLQTGMPFVRATLEDFERFPLLNPEQRAIEGRHTDLVVPLVWDDSVQGVAYIWRKDDPTPISRSEVQAATEAGRLAAMTILFSRQYRDERLQRQRLDTLLDVAGISSSSQGLDEVLQALAESVRAATRADVCSLYVFDESGEEVIAAYEDGLSPEDQGFFVASQRISPHDVPAELRVRRTLKPAIIRDFAAELAADAPLVQFAEENRISEFLLVPIAWQAELVGVMYCWYWDDERFSQDSIEAAEAIARQAGGVVSRARLQEAVHQQTVESDALLRIGQAVLTSDAFVPVLDEIAGALEELIPFDYAFVGMLTSDEKSVRVVREWGRNYETILNACIPVDESLTGYAVTTGQLVSRGRLEEDDRAWKIVPKRRHLQSIVVAPLMTSDRKLGALFIARSGYQRFTPSEERLLGLLSQQAAMAIERVDSREQLSRRAERQAMLAQVGDLLVSSENPESVLQQIASLATGVLANGIVFGLVDSEPGDVRWVADSFDDPELAEILHRGLYNLKSGGLRDRLQHSLIENRELEVPMAGIRDEQHIFRVFGAQLGVNYMLALPLFYQERAAGVMILLSREDTLQFREEDVAVARIVAEHIGDALERQQVKRNHEALLRISEAFHVQSEFSTLISTIALELERILPCDLLFVADYDRPVNMLHTQVLRMGGKKAPGRDFLPADEGICGEALQLRQPIIDNQADIRGTTVYREQSKELFYRERGESALVTPLIIEDEVIGVLFMSRAGHHRFTSIEFETFLLFAGLASAAMDRTMLEQRHRELYRASTEVLAAVVDAKDPTTLEHSRHVAFYSRLIADLMELPYDQIEHIELAGLLHDIGKLGIPDCVLQKPGKLTSEEFELIKTHPDRGARILERHPALCQLIPMVRHHHEAQDGSGYPSRLVGDQIPIGASIICVADAFDTMTSERTYQSRRPVDEALAELKRCAGTQFNADVVHRFVDCLMEDRSLVFGVEAESI